MGREGILGRWLGYVHFSLVFLESVIKRKSNSLDVCPMRNHLTLLLSQYQFLSLLSVFKAGGYPG